MANTLVFLGVEILLPSDVPFSHKDGLLEIDLSTGYCGKLLLKGSAQDSHRSLKTNTLEPEVH